MAWLRSFDLRHAADRRRLRTHTAIAACGAGRHSSRSSGKTETARAARRDSARRRPSDALLRAIPAAPLLPWFRPARRSRQRRNKAAPGKRVIAADQAIIAQNRQHDHHRIGAGKMFGAALGAEAAIAAIGGIASPRRNWGRSGGAGASRSAPWPGRRWRCRRSGSTKAAARMSRNSPSPASGGGFRCRNIQREQRLAVLQAQKDARHRRRQIQRAGGRNPARSPTRRAWSARGAGTGPRPAAGPRSRRIARGSVAGPVKRDCR